MYSEYDIDTSICLLLPDKLNEKITFKIKWARFFLPQDQHLRGSGVVKHMLGKNTVLNN